MFSAILILIVLWKLYLVCKDENYLFIFDISNIEFMILWQTNSFFSSVLYDYKYLTNVCHFIWHDNLWVIYNSCINRRNILIPFLGNMNLKIIKLWHNLRKLYVFVLFYCRSILKIVKNNNSFGNRFFL